MCQKLSMTWLTESDPSARPARFISTPSLDQGVGCPVRCAHDRVSADVIYAGQGQFEAQSELRAGFKTGERDQILSSGRIEAEHREDNTLTAVGGSAVGVVRSHGPITPEFESLEPHFDMVRYIDIDSKSIRQRRPYVRGGDLRTEATR